MNLVKMIGSLKQGILHRDWETVCEVYKDLSGEDLTSEAAITVTKEIGQKVKGNTPHTPHKAKKTAKLPKTIQNELKNNNSHETTIKPVTPESSKEAVAVGWVNSWSADDYDGQFEEDPIIKKKLAKKLKNRVKVKRDPVQFVDLICDGCNKQCKVHPKLKPIKIGGKQDPDPLYHCDRCLARKR
jgi:hypothetical protein